MTLGRGVNGVWGSCLRPPRPGVLAPDADSKGLPFAEPPPWEDTEGALEAQGQGRTDRASQGQQEGQVDWRAGPWAAQEGGQGMASDGEGGQRPARQRRGRVRSPEQRRQAEGRGRAGAGRQAPTYLPASGVLAPARPWARWGGC